MPLATIQRNIISIAQLGLASITLTACLPTPPRSPMMNTGGAVTAFVDVAVIPMDQERVLEGQTVLVQGGRITALGPTARVHVPVGALQIDGHGKFLIPGLADMHMHIRAPWTYGTAFGSPTSTLWLLLANGITTIRNVDYGEEGGELALQLRAREAAGDLLSPRIYTAGAIAIPNVGNITRQVSVYKARGYDFIKIHDQDSTTIDSIAVAAHQVGLPVLGHVPTGTSLEHALALHFTSIEHLRGYRDYFDTVTARTAAARIPAMAAATQQAGVWNCPTILHQERFVAGVDRDTLVQRPEMRYVTAKIVQYWKEAFRPDTEIAGHLDLQYHLILALQHAGAGLLSGTDAADIMPYMIPGFSLHRELQALVRSGLTPYQALVTSTRNVAVYFGTLDESGTITVGKRADLVLLNGNPLQDIRNTTQIQGVMRKGRWLSRQALDQLLVAVTDSVAAQNRVDAANPDH